MKLISITLENVRRFTDPVRITGIGPGLNVLAAPNEQGKSTFFDALQAVFFASHRSWDKSVKSLVPRVGGDPEVSVEFTVEGASWRLQKCWSGSQSRKDARLWRDGTLVGQKEEAETRLGGLLGATGDGGPAGLLWVRQGLVGLESGGSEQAARRDIMTSVAGEVAAMTGGRRMENALQSCAEFLNQHLTGKGKPKTNGGLAKCQGEVNELQARHDHLSGEVQHLQQDLDRRRKLRLELAELDAPEEHQARSDALAKAQAAFDAAKAHDQKVQISSGKVDTLQAQADNLSAQARALKSAITALGKAETAKRAAEDQHAAKAQSLEETASEFEAAKTALDVSTKAADKAAETSRLALQAELAARSAQRRVELEQRLKSAKALRNRIDELHGAIAAEISDADLQRLERLAADLQLALRSRESAAASFTMIYADGAAGGVSRDGQAVADNDRQAVPDGAVLDLHGLGQLHIHPAVGSDDQSLPAAKTALKDALADAGQQDMGAARDSARARNDTESDLAQARADLKALAPKGLAALHEQIAELPEPVALDAELPSVAQAEADERNAKHKRAHDAEKLEEIRVLHAARTADHARSDGDLGTALDRLERAQEALANQADPAAALQDLEKNIAETAVKLSAARVELDGLRQDAPDLVTAETALTRARSVVAGADKTIARLREERIGLDTRIGLRSSEAVEEDLSLVGERLQEANARLDAIAFEVRVYQRLQSALKDAQATARDRYVAPVHAQILPLLRMIWPDADPQIDPDTGMITRITRGAIEEDFDILSGGTQEQISLLVRLAFANLLAEDGRPAPVILDDAIVYTDDDRIEHMFNALTRQSKDLQIIVFSCRQRAFRALGGETLAIERVDA